MPRLRELSRRLLHRAVLRTGFALRRVKPFESRLLEHLLTTDDFYFVQVGAYNGITSDPFCKFLIDGLWKSVLVEPQRRYCEILQEIYRDRPDIMCRNVAIALTNKPRTLYRVAADVDDVPYWATQLASFHYEVVASHRERIPGIEALIVAEQVACLTLAELVAQESLPRVDLLAVDVEGSDFEVVQQIDALLQHPKFIYYEHLHLSPSDRDACCKFLKARGY
jgi:FkbM family methyltransferase